LFRASEEESERLRALAETTHETARALAEHEASLEARETALGDAQRGLEARGEELERWQEHLQRLSADAERADARIAEAAEREAALRALAHDLLNRYNDAGDE
jgi:chromosome segregation ATPase